MNITIIVISSEDIFKIMKEPSVIKDTLKRNIDFIKYLNGYVPNQVA